MWLTQPAWPLGRSHRQNFWKARWPTRGCTLPYMCAFSLKIEKPAAWAVCLFGESTDESFMYSMTHAIRTRHYHNYTVSYCFIGRTDVAKRLPRNDGGFKFQKVESRPSESVRLECRHFPKSERELSKLEMKSSACVCLILYGRF